MRVAVIRHDDADSAGFVGEAFEARGAEFDVRVFPGGSLPALDGVEHLMFNAQCVLIHITGNQKRALEHSVAKARHGLITTEQTK